MLVISNHIKQIGMELPPGAIVRINLAWVADAEDAKKIIEETAPNEIFLDFPTGRTKPPRPTLSICQAIDLIKEIPVGRVTYFAFSNANDLTVIEMLRRLVPPEVALVPKIETKSGIANLPAIARSAETDVIMLDKEDLYIDCGTDGVEFNKQVALARGLCREYGIKCLELKGVIFA